MNHQKYLQKQRTRRKFRVRKAIRGTTERPRLSVNRTLRHITCQLIDDSKGITIASASTLSGGEVGANCQAAARVGTEIAEKAKAAGVSKICFDRGHLRYHGRVAALAESIRSAGISV